MRLLTADGRELWLAYGMNVHPGGDADTLERALASTVAPLRARLGLSGPMGLALRLDAVGARALLNDERRLLGLRDRLRALDLVPYTLNGFVLGRFHGAGVKDEVYRPSWREAEREDATLVMAEVLAVLRGPGEVVSISTAPGPWRGWGEEPEDVARNCAARLARAARRLRELEHRTGTRVLLGLEPEPGTTLQTVPDVLRFFAGPLREAFGRDVSALRHLGLCYDVCHQSVLFEDPVLSLEALAAAHIPVVKVQASCALEAPQGGTPEARRALAAFDEPTWLHQTACRDARGRVHWVGDLSEALASTSSPWTDARAWRTHFHVPVFRGEALAPLHTTQPDLVRALRRVARGDVTAHLEVETYTWEALPEAERRAGSGFDLVEALARELEFVLSTLFAHGVVRAEGLASPSETLPEARTSGRRAESPASPVLAPPPAPPAPPEPPPRLPCALLVVSDRAAAGTRPDQTAELLRPVLAREGFDLTEVLVVPDEREQIAAALRQSAGRVPLVLTTGGTGVAPRDVTPEATRDVLEFEVPGLGEEMRRRSAAQNVKALGSRALGGVLGRAVVLNLPGRPQGAVECFTFVAAALRHLIALRRGPVADASHAPRPGA